MAGFPVPFANTSSYVARMYEIQMSQDDEALDSLLNEIMSSAVNPVDMATITANYVQSVEQMSAGIDEAGFVMRYQCYSVRILPPDVVSAWQCHGALMTLTALPKNIVSHGSDDQQPPSARCSLISLHPKPTNFSQISKVLGMLITCFDAANTSDLVVGVNLVAQENNIVSLSDFWLHMRFMR